MNQKNRDDAVSDIAILNQLGFSNRMKYGLLEFLVRNSLTPVPAEVGWITTMKEELDRLKVLVEAEMTAKPAQSLK